MKVTIFKCDGCGVKLDDEDEGRQRCFKLSTPFAGFELDICRACWEKMCAAVGKTWSWTAPGLVTREAKSTAPRTIGELEHEIAELTKELTEAYRERNTLREDNDAARTRIGALVSALTVATDRLESIAICESQHADYHDDPDWKRAQGWRALTKP